MSGAAPRPGRELSSQRGATAVEYALLAALIAGVVSAAVLAVGQGTSAMFEAVQWW